MSEKTEEQAELESYEQSMWVDAMLAKFPERNRADLELAAQQMSVREPFYKPEAVEGVIENQPPAVQEDTLVPRAMLVRKMDDDSLSQLALQISDSIAYRRLQLERELADDMDLQDYVLAELTHRLNQRNATEIFAPGVTVRREVTMKIQHRIDVLRSLEGLVPDPDFHKAVYEKTTTEWKADATKLKALAKRFGGRVAEIVEQGLPREQVGKPKLIVEATETQKNITPEAPK